MICGIQLYVRQFLHLPHLPFLTPFVTPADEGLRFISRLTDLRNLRIRQARFTEDVIPLTDDGLSFLQNLTLLEHLMYSQNRRAASSIIPDRLVFLGKGFSYLTALQNLTTLNVSCSDLETPGFASVTLLQSLTELNVSWCPWLLPNEAVILTKLQNLRVVLCKGTPFSDSSVAAAQQLRPDLIFDSATFV